MSSPAVAAIARSEWSRRRRSFVILGVLTGLFGGLVVAAAVMTRRTLTAPDRLFTATAPGDIHLQVFGSPDLIDRVIALPSVDQAWVGGVSVGRLEGHDAVQYVGVLAPSQIDGELMHPVVIDGRSPRADAVHEVVITEAIAKRGGLSVGNQLSLAMLSAAEVFQFDTGFGEPDGPTVEFTIVGVIRVAPGIMTGSPVMTSEAFAEEYSFLFAGADIYLTLDGGPRAVDRFTDEASDLAGEIDTADGTVPDFPVLVPDFPRSGTSELLQSSRVLFIGLISALLVAIAAVLAALVQAWSRHHGPESGRQRIESALGLTTVNRVAARTIPALATGAIAGLLAAIVGSLGSLFGPAGALGQVESDPGWRFDPAVVATGSSIVAIATVSVCAGAAWRAGVMAAVPAGRDRGTTWRLVPRRGGWPLAGAAFALSPYGGSRHVPVRMSLVACAVGVAGIVGSSTFGASLDRLVTTPERYGWTADFAIVDINDEVLGRLLADERFEAVGEYASANVEVEGRTVPGYASTPVTGHVDWVLAEGSLPEMDDEVVLGRKLADQLDAEVGDRVEVGGQDMIVAGIGLGPNMNGEALGSSVLMDPDGLTATATAGQFREALVRVRPGVDPEAVAAEYGSEFELTVRELPTAVRNVAELGSLPAVLGTFLAVLAAVALSHALIVTSRQRAGDVAVLRALGATPRDAALVVVTMALATVLIGVVIGVPLGWALARLLWGELARSIGVASDVTGSWTAVAGLAMALLVAVLLAVLPARRASRVDPGRELRTD